MKALVCEAFSDDLSTLKFQDIALPALGPDDVRVSVRAACVNFPDLLMTDGKYQFKPEPPYVVGQEMAGDVIAVGSAVTQFEIGDRVIGGGLTGAFAEEVSLPEGSLALMPRSVGFPEAAALPIAGLAALLALSGLGRVRSGDEVLIHGSSGAAGLFAIQLAKHFGARVTTVSGTRGAAASRAMGADQVFDYKSGPVVFAGAFDIIIDFSGTFPFARARRHLKRAGRFIESSPTLPKFLGSMIANLFRAKKHLMLTTKANSVELELLASLVDSGRLKITVARIYPLAEARQAFIEQEKGGTVGKIVVTAGRA